MAEPTRFPRSRPAWRRGVPAAAAIVGLAAALLAPVTTSDAAWVDLEWTGASVSTLDCAVTEGLSSRGTGRVVTGEILGASLDPLVALDGVDARNDGVLATATPATAASLGDDAYNTPLTLSALGGLVSSEIGIDLPIAFGAGTYAQYGQAHGTGLSTGASGVVTDQGAVDMDAIRSGSAPSLGTIRLSDLPGLGAALGGLTDVTLEVGAVAASATVDGCADLWDGAEETALQRSYAVSGLDLALVSPAVQTLDQVLGGALEGTLTDLGQTVVALETAVGPVVQNGLGGILTGLLDDDALSLGTITPTIDVALDPRPVLTLLTRPLTDGAVTVDLTSGTVAVDLAAVMGGLYEDSDGLNGRAPNTPVLSADVLGATIDRIAKLLRDPSAETGLLYDLEDALTRMVLDATVSMDVEADIKATLLSLVTVPVIDLDVSIRTTVGGLVGTGYPPPTIGVQAALLNGGLLGVLLTPVNALVSVLLGSLGGAVSSVLLPTVAATLDALLLTPATGLIGTTLNGLVSAVTTLVDALDGALGLLSQIVSVTVNSQPDHVPYPTSPGDDLPGERMVSALRIGALDGPSAGAASLLNLFLATAGVGPNVR